MICLVLVAACTISAILEALPIDWLFIPRLINETLILWDIG